LNTSCKKAARADCQQGKKASKKDLNVMKIITSILAVSVLSLAACNTVEGIGKDIKQGGKAIEKTARDVQN